MSHLIHETFTPTDFRENDPIPPESIGLLQEFHEKILMPVINKFGSLISTSGHRSEEANRLAHGQPNSHHIYSALHVADDFYSPNVPARTIFDWMRMDPTLPFSQLILEHSANGSSVIHVSMNTAAPGVRSVLEGATHNATAYAKVDHVDFIPVQDATAG